MQRVLLATLGLAVLVGLAISVDCPLEETSKGVQFTYEDSTSGNGYFASNNKITAHGAHADSIVTSRLADMHLSKRVMAADQLKENQL